MVARLTVPLPGESALNLTCKLCEKGAGLIRCSGCYAAHYCSVEHQREDWKTHYHRRFCKASSDRAPGSRLIGILDIEGDLPEFHWTLRNQIQLRAEASTYMTTTHGALSLLVSPSPLAAIWVVSNALTTNPHLLAALLSYVKTGAVIVLGGTMQSFTPLPDLDTMFASLELPWKTSGYHRTTHSLQRSHPLVPTLGSNLLQSY